MKTRLIAVAAVATVCLAAGAAAQESQPGVRYFKQYCAACHGLDAKGAGPAAPAMKVKVPDLTVLQQKGQDFPTMAVMVTIDGTKAPLAHGSTGMPIWGRAFEHTKGTPRPENVIYSIVNFLKSVQENKPPTNQPVP